MSGLSVALMMPKMRATRSRVPSFDQPLPASSSIPGTAAVATARAAAETTTRSRNLIVQILLDYSRSDVWACGGRGRGRPGQEKRPGQQAGGGSGRGTTPARGKPASPKRVTLALLRPLLRGPSTGTTI